MIKNKNNFYKKLSITVIVIGILLRFFLTSFYVVSGDACWQLSAARFLAENKKFPLYEPLGRPEPFWAPPVFHVMSAFFYSAFGIFGNNAAEFGMKMLSPLLGSLTLIFIYLINKKLFDEKTAFYSLLFTTFVPMFVDYNVFSYIDGVVTFFIVLGIYFTLNGKYIKSSIAGGLAALTKYNGIFVLPLLIYITCKGTKNRKELAKKLAVFLIVPMLIASPWFIRNYNDFGNPVWPFMNFIFNGKDTSAFESSELQKFRLGNVFSINSITFTYLSIFGVPNGNYNDIFFFKVPYIKALFVIWLFGTLVFLLPFAKGFAIKDKTKKRILIIWIVSYLAVLILYIGNVGWTAGRFFMPALPALGMIYGNGFSRIRFKSKNLMVSAHIILLLIILGLVAAESTKIILASRQWDSFEQDFMWIKDNTNKNALIMPDAQCLAYHTNRGTIKGTKENLKEADYIFVNQNFNLERRAMVSDEILKELKTNASNYNKVYENKITKTSVYKVKK